MTLRHLEIFLAVCGSMSMTKAAQQLHMAQPAVSRAIAELEEFYHVSLFDRIGRRLYLTSAGTALKQYAETILSQYEESVSVLRNESTVQKCRLCVSPAAGETILADLIEVISSRLKDIDLTVGVHDDAVIEGMLKANDCDIAIMTPEKDPLFHTVPLYKDNYVFAASSGLIPQSHILREHLLKQRLLLQPKGCFARNLVDPYLEKISFPSSQIWESESEEALLSLAEAGFGIALLPQSRLAKRRGSLHTVTAGSELLQRKICLVIMKGRFLNQKTQACMEIIRDYCRNR